MRWFKKEEKPYRYPKQGETCRCTEFLWFPLTIVTETRWLEKATIEYKYSDYSDDGKYPHDMDVWTLMRFID